MARKPRVHAPGALYHVMLRGNAGADLFFSDRDRLRFESIIADGVPRFEHRLLAYCWMTNHLHLAIQVGVIPLAKIIQNLAFRYARWSNWKQGRLGHVFQGRYKALLVDRDRYLLALVRYIHQNPVKAGLVARPEDYRWSSHRAYLGLERVPWLSTAPVLRCFGERVGESRQRFKVFVDEKTDGSGGEYANVDAQEGALLPIADPLPVPRREAIPPAHSRPSIDKICTIVCGELDLREVEVSSNSRARQLSRARHLIAFLTLAQGCGTLAELGRRFGRDPAALHRGVARLRGEIARDAVPQQMIARLFEALSISQ
ncbi:MAG: transposase [Myxococcota bacterium]